MKQEESKETKTDISMFNLAMPYLGRINSLLSKISDHYLDGHFDKMAWALKALYRELSPKLNKTERKEFLDLFNKAMMARSERFKLLKEIGKDKFTTEAERKKIVINSFKQKKTWHEGLEDLDILLREYLEDRGMLVPNMSDPRFLKGGG